MLPRVQGQPKATEWQNETLFKKKKKKVSEKGGR